MPDSDLEIVPVNVDGQRVDFVSVTKIKTGLMVQRFFKTYDFLWYLEVKENDFFLSGGKPYLKKISGRNNLGRVCGLEKEIGAVVISVGTLVPEAIRDVILYHELREAFWRFVQGMSLKEAHERAVQEGQEYVNKYLSSAEREILENFKKEVEKWEPRPVSDEDFKSNKADGWEKI